MVIDALVSYLALIGWVVIPTALAYLSLHLWETHKRRAQIVRSRAARTRAASHISWEKP